MRVVYTHDIFSRQSVGGISRYFVELIRHLAEGPAEIQVFAGRHANTHLAELEGQKGLLGQFQSDGGGNRFFRYVRNQLKQCRYARSAGVNIVHHTYYSLARPFPSARLIVTVYDLIPEKFPKQFGWKGRLLSAAKFRTCSQADRILAISETTKNDLLEHFHLSPDLIDVAYLGNSLSRYVHEVSDSPYHAPYILYVGARGGYKNCRALWEAYSQSDLLRNHFHIVCFGGGAFTTRERWLLEDLKVSHSVRQTNGDDRTLARYYRHASALVYPSHYEGFGLPPVEAMSFGCPVIASTGGSIPEVVGPAGAYFDPDDPEMLRHVLETVLFNSSIQDRLREEMKRRVLLFDWKRSAQQTLACYQRAAA